MATTEPRNPFYFLLLAVSLVFVATALAYGVLPVLEENAVSLGQRPPASAFRTALRSEGPLWLLYELGAMTLFVGLSFWLDWRRTSRIQPPPTATKLANEPPLQDNQPPSVHES